MRAQARRQLRDDLADLGGLAGLRREAVLGKGHGASKDAPAGMRVLRPLMGMRREEVRSALRREQLEWREDSSNGGSQFSRNRVRNEVLDAPLLPNPTPLHLLAQ